MLAKSIPPWSRDAPRCWTACTSAGRWDADGTSGRVAREAQGLIRGVRCGLRCFLAAPLYSNGYADNGVNRDRYAILEIMPGSSWPTDRE